MKNCHTSPLFYKLNLLKLKDIHKLHSSLFMHDIIHKNISDTFVSMFTPLTEIHHYETRQKSKQIFFIESTRTDYKKRFIAYNGIKIWEDIPGSIKSTNRHLFKHNYSSYLISTYSESWLPSELVTDMSRLVSMSILSICLPMFIVYWLPMYQNLSYCSFFFLLLFSCITLSVCCVLLSNCYTTCKGGPGYITCAGFFGSTSLIYI